PLLTHPPEPATEAHSKEEQKWADKTPYGELVGSLIYATKCTRPDINFAVHYAARFNHSFRREHRKSAKRTLAYLKQTQHFSLQYSKNASPELVGYVDADWARDQSDRKSVYGYVFMLAGAAITWKTKKQVSVALSTCEAEYYGMSEAAQEATYLRHILDFIHLSPSGPTTIFVDNRSAIALSKNPVHHTRAKHIDIRYHYNREAQERKIVSFLPIASAEN